MKNFLFIVFSSILVLVVQYIWDVSVPYSEAIFTVYCFCTCLISIYAGIHFQRVKSLKLHFSSEKMNIKLLFQKERNDTDKNELEKKCIRMYQLFTQIMFFVLIWNVLFIFSNHNLYFVEKNFLAFFDNISYFLEDMIFSYSGKSPNILFASDYLSIIGLHNILVFWEAYIFSYFYHEFKNNNFREMSKQASVA